MWESLISILMMGATFLYMINKAHFAQTRRVALVPLGFCAVDMLCAGTVPFGTYPVIAIMLVILRLTVLLCCAGAMHKDTDCPTACSAQRTEKGLQLSQCGRQMACYAADDA